MEEVNDYKCDSCGAPLSPEHKYCDYCGTVNKDYKDIVKNKTEDSNIETDLGDILGDIFDGLSVLNDAFDIPRQPRPIHNSRPRHKEFGIGEKPRHSSNAHISVTRHNNGVTVTRHQSTTVHKSGEFVNKNDGHNRPSESNKRSHRR